MVGVLLLAPRVARQPHGDFPDALPARAAAVLLPAQGGESRRLQGESGARGSHVPNGHFRYQREPSAGGEMTRSIRNLAAVHVASNALLLWLGYYWLGIGESRAASLLWSAVVALVLLCLSACLHGAAFAYFAGKPGDVPAAFRTA